MSLNIIPPLTADIPDSPRALERYAIRHQVHQAWQAKATMTSGKTALSSPKPEGSILPDKEIADFIESLRTGTNVYPLLYELLSNQSSAARQDIIAEIAQRLRDIDTQEGSNLLKDKFNPIYSMYIATGMLLAPLTDEIFSKLGRPPSENDDEDDEI